MTRFRPCIDLHSGQVKQIVGGTLDSEASELKTNFVSTHTASYYAQLYKDKDLAGAHVIMLGPGNTDAAREALGTWPGGLQVGGGITDQNAQEWIDSGAEKVLICDEGPLRKRWLTFCRSSSHRFCFRMESSVGTGWIGSSRHWEATSRGWSLTSAAGGRARNAGTLL
jgi:phosphoribosylformimino-5-aminoimidazole carboxamide ribonucleotide (ProFAR) isomerase